MFGMLKGLVGSKSLTREDMESVLDKMKDHLIGAMQSPPPRWCLDVGIETSPISPQPRM